MREVKSAKATIAFLAGLLCLAAFLPDGLFLVALIFGAFVAMLGLMLPSTRWLILAAGACGFFKYGQFLAEHKNFVGGWPGFVPAFILAILAILSYPMRWRGKAKG